VLVQVVGTEEEMDKQLKAQGKHPGVAEVVLIFELEELP
jgi:hypothetical protein